MNVVQPTCKYCEKTFTRKKNLYQHIRNVHNENITTGSLKCPITQCEVCVRTRELLREHLANIHYIKDVEEREEHQFHSFTSFLQWKEATEEKLKSSYVSSATFTLANKSKKRYFFCHRSGIFTSNASGLRVAKSQGTCKIGVHCPSTIEVTEKENDKINVIFYPTHVGHETEVKHHTLSKSVKSIDFQNTINVDNKLDDEDNNKIKLKLSHALTLLEGKILSSETKKKIIKHIETVITLIDSNDQKPLQAVNSEPPNKKIKLQQRFYSTKKKRISNNLSISKHTINYTVTNRINFK